MQLTNFVVILFGYQVLARMLLEALVVFFVAVVMMVTIHLVLTAQVNGARHFRQSSLDFVPDHFN